MKRCLQLDYRAYANQKNKIIPCPKNSRQYEFYIPKWIEEGFELTSIRLQFLHEFKLPIYFTNKINKIH